MCVVSGPDLSKCSYYLKATWCSTGDMRMVRQRVSTPPGDLGWLVGP